MQKLTMLINSNGGIACGWSETMYTDLSDATATRSLCQSWMIARSKLLSQGFKIQGVRIGSDPATPPVFTYFFPSPAPIIGQRLLAPDYPNTSVLIQLRSGQSVESRDLRGWPDSFIEATTSVGDVRLTSEGQGFLNDYIAFLVARPLGWARAKKQGDAGFVTTPVTSLVVQVSGSQAVLVGGYPGTMTGGNKGTVRIRGFKGEGAYLNGVYSKESYDITVSALTVKKTLTAGIVNAYVPNTANVSLQSIVFASINAGTYQRVSSRKTGRPFAQLRGRR